MRMTVAEIWTLSVGAAPTVDLSGFKVEALDGSIGKVDEATYEAGGSFIVVDTGPWIFGKKVMLPAGVIDRVDSEGETIYVRLTKDEIKNAPEFDRDLHLQDEEYQNRLGGYYSGSRKSRSEL